MRPGRDVTSTVHEHRCRTRFAMQDVYGEIAASVQELMAEEAAAGLPEAKALVGHINRKLVKQTVMTSVYGVTFVGARQQIRNRLLERHVPDDAALFKTSFYAATVRGVALGLRLYTRVLDSALQIRRNKANSASLARCPPRLRQP